MTDNIGKWILFFGMAPCVALATEPAPLTGWVDMHTHPMAHLAFGGKLMHGAPDLGIVMPAIPDGWGCRHYDFPVDREEASQNDRAIHGGGTPDNSCGDYLRREFIRGLEGSLDANIGHNDDGALGYPVFNTYPAHDDLTHQQMWVGWVERAWQGGLRVMVSLAVNNRTIAAAVMGPGDINGDDAASAQIQLDEMKVMVGQHDWMEIAYTPADLRRIVGEGRLAIVLGVEIDNIGNMQWNPGVLPDADAGSRAFIDAQLDALLAEGVRYVFPVHVVDNKLGKTAVYIDQFNMSNYHQTGEFWELACAPADSDVEWTFEVAGFDLPYAIIKAKIGIDPFREPPPPPACGDLGHVNDGGLTPLGEYALEAMMLRGMLIDIDHMSSMGVQDSLDIAESNNYPLNSGHDSPRHPAWAARNENQRTDSDYRRIADLGGMIGMGSEETATDFVRSYQYVNAIVDGMQIAIGTDANGLVILPGPDAAAHLDYSSYPRLSDGSRTWDINTDGVANYGLFADYVRLWPEAGMSAAEHDAFFTSAEGFAHMWETALDAQAAMIPTPPVADAGGPYAVDEGGTVQLDATGSSDVNQDAASLTYEWDLDADGAYDDASGATPDFSALDGPDLITVSVRVTDEDGMTDTTSAQISVNNVAPTTTLTQLPPALVFQGLTADFAFGAVTDPSAADVLAGFEFALDCTDDGTLDAGWSNSATATCSYPDSGSFTVRGKVRDKDGGVGEATTTVEVLTPLQATDAIAEMIEELRADGVLNDGQANALLSVLDNARDRIEAGDARRALQKLGVLLAQIASLVEDGVLTPAQADALNFEIGRQMASIEATT